ncbi:hypothetical protein ASG25_19590 [Rhizobium sp. Leaf384]|uniref:DUF6894 family protein n=1 Tax=unclassified Rhizobium TaxID=2613769 RepID=UPI0007154D21|nr:MULTISPECIES: hypothetical protein [unclassified Rhizobium]KQS75571.1 hypothetical protein ASG25_19590 [Rhizobium sp. Leaf384]KQS75820.1 hypothetical protein ASG58_13270 [Rhizobium sp. Leaf383]
MRIRFFTDEGGRIDDNGGASLPDLATAEQEALSALQDWLRDLAPTALPATTAVIGERADGTLLFRVQLDVTIERFDGDGS